MNLQATITYTHKGWFGLCPVFVGNIDGEFFDLDPRHWIFDPLFWLSGLLFDLLFFVTFQPEAEWPVLLTGELDSPRSVTFDLDSEDEE